MQRLQLPGLCTGFSGSAALDSFSQRRNSSSSFAVFPGEVFAAGIVLVGIVPDPVDQNDFSFRFLLISISSLVVIRHRGSPETTKALW